MSLGMKVKSIVAIAGLCLFSTTLTWADEVDDAALLEAGRIGHEAEALILLRNGADPSVTSADGTTVLHWAAMMGEVDLVKALLAAGADVHAVNDYYTNPMAAAVERSNPEVIAALLNAGADPESTNPDGQTALMVVARGGNVEAAELLIAAGANINAQERLRGQTALMWAAVHQRVQMIRVLLANGADPDVRNFPTRFKRYVTAEPRAQYRPHGGMSAAIYAGREGCAECMQALIDGGADIDLGDYKGITPLIVALNNLHFDTAKVLVEGGADLNQWDRWGRSPLYMAIDLNQVPEGGRVDIPSLDATTGLDIARLLLEGGADVNPQLKLFPPYRHLTNDRGCDAMLTIGTTPLVRAAKVADTAAVELLLEYGASQDLLTVTGITPIMAASGLKSIECDIRGGRSYLNASVQDRHVATLQLLIDAGGNVNGHEIPEMEGFYAAGASGTPLHGAGFWGWDRVAKLLVENGAKIDALDGRGRSPIDSAMGRAGGHERGGLILVFEALGDYLRDTCNQQVNCSPIENIASK